MLQNVAFIPQIVYSVELFSTGEVEGHHPLLLDSTVQGEDTHVALRMRKSLKLLLVSFPLVRDVGIQF
jgi:hypothetical protein